MPKQAKQNAKRVGEFALPGDVLLDVRGNTPSMGGEGTQRRGARLCATVAGRVVAGEGEAIAVQRKVRATRPPYVGAVILGKVTKVVGNYAQVDVFTVSGKLCHTTFKGTVRGEDTRPVSSNILDNMKAVEMWRCLKPNDVVRAEVIGLGDQKSYQLSTVRKELGVVYATSTAGHQLVPRGPETMECTATGIVEPRKVAVGGHDFWWL